MIKAILLILAFICYSICVVILMYYGKAGEQASLGYIRAFKEISNSPNKKIRRLGIIASISLWLGFISAAVYIVFVITEIDELN